MTVDACTTGYSSVELLYTPVDEDDCPPPALSTAPAPAPPQPAPAPPQPAPALAGNAAPMGLLGMLSGPAALVYEEVAGTATALAENPLRVIPAVAEGVGGAVMAAALVLLTPSRTGEGDGSGAGAPPDPGPPPGDPNPLPDLGPAIGAYLLAKAASSQPPREQPRDFDGAGQTDLRPVDINGKRVTPPGFVPQGDEAPPGFITLDPSATDPDRPVASGQGDPGEGANGPSGPGAPIDSAEPEEPGEADPAGDDAPATEAGGIGVPVRTASRKGLQFDEIVQEGTTDPHQHPTTEHHGGYNTRQLTPSAQFADFVRDLGPRAHLVLSSIPQALNRGCCPLQPYYLSNKLDTVSSGGRPLDPVIGRLYANGTIKFPDDHLIEGRNGQPVLLRAGSYKLSQLDPNPSTRPPQLPTSGHRLVQVNFIPDGADLPLDPALRLKDLVDFTAGTLMSSPDVAPKLSLGLTNVSPRLPNGDQELKDALAYMVQTYPDVDFRIAGLGETNFFNKEAVEYMVSKSGESPHSMENADRFLGFLNDEVPGAMAVIHMDAGRSIESGVAGQPVRLLFSGKTEYTNVERIIEIAHTYPNVNFVWAHAGGLSRSGKPGDFVDDNGVHGLHTDMLRHVLASTSNVYVDMSWGTVAEKVVIDNANHRNWAAQGGRGIMNEFPDRFIYGSDAVGQDLASYLEPLKRYSEGGIINALTMAPLFLQDNGKRLIDTGVHAFENYMQTHEDELQSRPLPEPWRPRATATVRPPAPGGDDAE